MCEISLEERKNESCDGLFENFFMIIDGSDFPIRTPYKNKQERLKYFSGRPKDKLESRYNIKYIIGVQIKTGKITYLGCPTEGSRHDITALRRSGLVAIVKHDDEFELLLADKGFIGEDCCITPYKQSKGKFLSEGQKIFNKMITSVRQIVECTIHRLKIFGILGSAGKWRWDKNLHPHFVNLCAQITNICIERNPVWLFPNMLLTQ